MKPSFRHALSLLPALTLLVACIASPAMAQRAHQKGAGGKHSQKQETPPASMADRFQVSSDGKTAHDALLHVTWLLDANVGKSECAGVPNVGKGGGMDWPTAWACIKHLNSGNGYLGHANWQMPATPMVDHTCKATGKQGNSFAADCSGSAYGSLYYLAFQRHFGEPVARQTGPTIGGFSNLQPTLYWSGNSLTQQKSGHTKRNPNSGYNSFSFSNGWQGANVDHHVIYILPMIPGPVPAGTPAAGATIYDAGAESGVPGKTGVSWLADANVAGDPQFLQTVQATKLGIGASGAMEQGTAQQLIKLMRQHKYLGRDDWALPLASSTNCTVKGKTGSNDGYRCTGSAMGHLYYEVFKLEPGTAVADPADIPQVKPFTGVQPSLYWGCTAGTPDPKIGTIANLCASDPTAASGMGFSFDMGSGFTDTTVLASALYLMVHYPDPPTGPTACSTPECRCMQAGGTFTGGKCQ